MRFLTLSFLLIFGLSCSSDSNPDEELFFFGSGNTTFVYPIASSTEECLELLNQGVNCAQWLELFPDSTSEVIVTDILQSGEYLSSNDTLTIIMEIAFDVESPMIFISNDDFTQIRRISDGSNTIWKLQIEGKNPWDL
ncbi:MAG: hypothetical protein ED557_05505 [Balneola sp.]|nr:MAG: hypothetical protein ED557_05505 [Balneola sp.]